MITLELYSKEDCSLCDKAKDVIHRVRQRIPFEYHEVSLVRGTPLEAEMRNDIPVLRINGVFFAHHVVSEEDLINHLVALGASRGDQ